jgi:hypothetical protein
VLEFGYCFLDFTIKLFQNPMLSSLNIAHCALNIFPFLHHSLFLALLFYCSYTFSKPHAVADDALPLSQLQLYAAIEYKAFRVRPDFVKRGIKMRAAYDTFIPALARVGEVFKVHIHRKL